MEEATSPVDISSIRQAQQRISGFARTTPIISSRYLSHLAGSPVYLKVEALQRTGSFKVRGAANKLALLSEEERSRGVIAASAGNHGQGVAVVADGMGVSCTVIMPKGASVAKVQATRGYHAQVVLHEEPLSHARTLAKEKGLIFIHPFDDPAVIAGQGTIGLEIIEKLPDVEQVIVPVGGGGLAAGIAVAVKSLRPQARIIGVQAAAAPAIARSFRDGRPLAVPPHPTIADGVAVAAPGEVTFPLLRQYLDDIVVISEDVIAQAIALLLERAKLVVEGAGALGVAALIDGQIPAAKGPTVIVISGGNIDIPLLARTAEHGLVHAGRYLSLNVGLADRPGQLAHLLAIIAATEANVLEVQHHRLGERLPIGRVRATLLLEVRDLQHSQEVSLALEGAGYTRVPLEEPPGQRQFVPRSWLQGDGDDTGGPGLR